VILFLKRSSAPALSSKRIALSLWESVLVLGILEKKYEVETFIKLNGS
jgi:hypothetical protein